MKATMPSTAWCSGELEIKNAPVTAPQGRVEPEKHRMNRHAFSRMSMALAIALIGACSQDRHEDAGIGAGAVKKWNDPDVEILGIGAYNYTDHDIYDVFILPPDKNDIKFAAATSGGRTVTRTADKWRLDGASSPDLVWDFRWSTPKRFKVWWFRIVDMKTYSASAGHYDQYTTKATWPGAAWCEGEIVVAHAPVRHHDDSMLLHFYPDGHVEGDVLDIEGDASHVDFNKRLDLPVLKERPCLKEVPNPYFGKKKPVAMY